MLQDMLSPPMLLLYGVERHEAARCAMMLDCYGGVS